MLIALSEKKRRKVRNNSLASCCIADKCCRSVVWWSRSCSTAWYSSRVQCGTSPNTTTSTSCKTSCLTGSTTRRPIITVPIWYERPKTIVRNVTPRLNVSYTNTHWPIIRSSMPSSKCCRLVRWLCCLIWWCRAKEIRLKPPARRKRDWSALTVTRTPRARALISCAADVIPNKSAVLFSDELISHCIDLS